MSFSFIQITDHHLGASEHVYNHGYATAHALGRVLDHIAEADGWGAEFLICTGDLVNMGTADEYGFFRRLAGLEGAAAAPGPLRLTRGQLGSLRAYFIPGNHDARPVFFNGFFTGTPSDAFDANMAFEHGGVQFLCLDFGTGGRAGEVRPETLAFVRARLAGGRPSVLFMHYHPVAVGIPWLDAALPPGIEAFWDIVESGRVLGVFFGHAHTTVETRVRGIPVMGLRSTNFQFAVTEQPVYCLLPPHYRVVTVRDGALTSQICEVRL
jgi:Icc protein